MSGPAMVQVPAEAFAALLNFAQDVALDVVGESEGAVFLADWVDSRSREARAALERAGLVTDAVRARWDAWDDQSDGLGVAPCRCGALSLGSPDDVQSLLPPNETEDEQHHTLTRCAQFDERSRWEVCTERDEDDEPVWEHVDGRPAWLPTE